MIGSCKCPTTRVRLQLTARLHCPITFQRVLRTQFLIAKSRFSGISSPVGFFGGRRIVHTFCFVLALFTRTLVSTNNGH